MLGGLLRDNPEEEALELMRNVVTHAHIRHPEHMEAPYVLTSVVHCKYESPRPRR